MPAHPGWRLARAAPARRSSGNRTARPARETISDVVVASTTRRTADQLVVVAQVDAR